jgi:hypothetical protein
VKHYSKRARHKAKRVNAQPKVEELARGPQAERPTAERMARGVWTEPKGMGKNEIPVTDLAADMIGLLLIRRIITDSQEQAARTFQAARLAYLAELPEISGYKSCIAGDVPGYDDGDGCAETIERYRKIERAVGIAGRRELLHVCEEGQKPHKVDVLRWALDAISEMRY